MVSVVDEHPLGNRKGKDRDKKYVIHIFSELRTEIYGPGFCLQNVLYTVLYL